MSDPINETPAWIDSAPYSILDIQGWGETTVQYRINYIAGFTEGQAHQLHIKNLTIASQQDKIAELEEKLVLIERYAYERAAQAVDLQVQNEEERGAKHLASELARVGKIIRSLGK